MTNWTGAATGDADETEVPAGRNRENTFDDPAGNAVDAGGVANADASPVTETADIADIAATGSTDHHGQDGGRDTVTVAQAQSRDAGAATQDLPAMSQNNATDEEKLAGILAQTRGDAATEPLSRVEELLRARIHDAGLAVDDARLSTLAGEIAPDEDRA